MQQQLLHLRCKVPTSCRMILKLQNHLKLQHRGIPTMSAAVPGQQSTAPPQPAAHAAAQQEWYQKSSIYYSNYPFNRAADARKDEAQVAAWFNANTAKVLPVSGSRVLVTKITTSNSNSNSSDSSINDGHGGNNITRSSSDGISGAQAGPKFQTAWVSPAGELAGAMDAAVPPLFLGLDESNTPHFAVQISRSEQEGLAASQGGHWVVARTAGPDMGASDAAVVAVASGLAQWHLDSQYHGATGSKTLPQDGGFSRACTSSQRVLYPRVDPAIITLITAGEDWCLLGRKAGWPIGRYSTLAGFLEIGETLEQALCREVAEESGVMVELQSVRYVASQPWPFPRSLMVGFYASAAGTGAADAGSHVLSAQGRMAMVDTGLRVSEVSDALAVFSLQRPTPQEDEMEDVRWFHRDWLQQAVAAGPAAAPGGFMIPGNYSLAHKLITGWLEKSTAAAAAAAASITSTNGSSGSNGWLGNAVPQVAIDDGVFKYVLLRLSDSQGGRGKLLVRGAAAAAYHDHILQHTRKEVQQLSGGSLQVEVLGGGRIEHYPEQGAISVYGYSSAFGPAAHEVTVGLLRRWYPLYAAEHITWSYEGY